MDKIEKVKVNWQAAFIVGILLVIPINIIAIGCRNFFPKDLIGFAYAESFFSSISLLAGLVLVLAFKQRTNGWMFILIYWYAHSEG